MLNFFLLHHIMDINHAKIYLRSKMSVWNGDEVSEVNI